MGDAVRREGDGETAIAERPSGGAFDERDTGLATGEGERALRRDRLRVRGELDRERREKDRERDRRVPVPDSEAVGDTGLWEVLGLCCAERTGENCADGERVRRSGGPLA